MGSTFFLDHLFDFVGCPLIRCQQTALCTGTEQISKEGKGKGKKTDKKDDDKEDTEKDSGLSKNGTVDEGKKKKTNQTGKGGKDQKNVSDTDIKGADSNKNGSVKVEEKQNQTEKTTGAGYVLGLLGLGEKEKDSAKKKDLDEGKDKKNVSKTDIKGAGLKKNETLEENVSDTGVKRAKLNKQTVKENQTEKSTSFLGWLGLGSEEEDPAKKKDEDKGQKKNTEKESGLSKNGTAEEGNKEKTNQTEKSSSEPKRLIRFRHAKSAI